MINKTIKSFLMGLALSTTLGTSFTTVNAEENKKSLFTTFPQDHHFLQDDKKEFGFIKSLAIEERIEFITRYFESRKLYNDSVYKHLVYIKDRPVVNDIHKEFTTLRKNDTTVVKEVNKIIEEVSLERNIYEDDMHNLFTTMKDALSSSTKFDQHVRNKLILFEMKRELHGKRIESFADNKRSWSPVNSLLTDKDYLKELVRLSKGEDNDSLGKVVSLFSKEQPILFFEHELIKVNSIPEDNFISIPKISSMFSFLYEFNEQENVYTIYNDNNKLSILDNEVVIFNNVEMGKLNIFQKNGELLHVDYHKLIEILGYHIEFIGDDKTIPYIYKDELASSPLSLLSVDDLIETTFAIKQK